MVITERLRLVQGEARSVFGGGAALTDTFNHLVIPDSIYPIENCRFGLVGYIDPLFYPIDDLNIENPKQSFTATLLKVYPSPRVEKLLLIASTAGIDDRAGIKAIKRGRFFQASAIDYFNPKTRVHETSLRVDRGYRLREKKGHLIKNPLYAWSEELARLVGKFFQDEQFDYPFTTPITSEDFLGKYFAAALDTGNVSQLEQTVPINIIDHRIHSLEPIDRRVESGDLDGLEYFEIVDSD